MQIPNSCAGPLSPFSLTNTHTHPHQIQIGEWTDAPTCKALLPAAAPGKLFRTTSHEGNEDSFSSSPGDTTNDS